MIQLKQSKIQYYCWTSKMNMLQKTLLMKNCSKCRMTASWTQASRLAASYAVFVRIMTQTNFKKVIHPLSLSK